MGIGEEVVCQLVAVGHAGEGEELKELVLVPDGTVESIKGAFLVDAEAGKLIVEQFEGHGVAMVIDYEHQSLGGEFSAPDGRAKAAGWVEKLNYIPGRGIVGQVKWNAAARAAIREDEYRYLSPVVLVRKSDRKAVRLVSVGLTNQPAIPRMERVAASRGLEQEKMIMAEEPTGAEFDAKEFLDRMAEIMGVTDPGLSPQDRAAQMLEKARTKFKGGGDEEEGGEEGGEVAASIRTALELTEKADVETVVAAIKTLREGQKPVAELQKKVETLSNSLAERDARDVLAPFIAKGVIDPEGTDDASKADFAIFSKMARDNPKDCVHILNSRVAVLPPEGKTEGPEKPATGAGGNRETIIANAARKYDSETVLQGLTDKDAFVDDALRRANMKKLTDEELKTLVA